MVKHKKKEKLKLKARKNKEPRFDISQETRNSILGILSFILAVLSILSFLNMAGKAGEIFGLISKSLFGWGFFLVPGAFFLLGLSFIKSLSRKIYLSAVFGTALFVFSILGIFFIIGHGEFGQRIIQGGYFGVILGYPFLAMTGFSASLVIFISLIFISLLLSLNVPIYRLMKKEKDEEEEEKLVDNIVVKNAIESSKDAFKKSPLSQVVAKAAKVDLTDKEFAIKNMKLGKWTLPPFDLLHGDGDQPTTGDINATANIIKRTLGNFAIDVEMGEVSVGPTVTRYTLRPAVGVKLSKITALNPDLSLALAAPHLIRIEAPIPGKSLVGVEVPNKKVAIIGLRNLLEHEDHKKSKYFLPLAIGRDVAGQPIFAGLEKMPHLLVAGATGSGKSVSINTIILSLLYKHSPEVLKLILVDPKRVELTLYNGIPHLITPVITEGKKVLGALRWAVGQMEGRFETLSKAGARDIFSYNAKQVAKKEEIMPFIVIVIDELADLMASFGRDLESAIVRLAQMSRAVGIHLIVSTQRPSVEVITGTIKANITSRMAFQVASNVDSGTKPRRLQGSLVSEKEVKDVVKFIVDQAKELELGEEDEDLKVDFNAPARSMDNVGESGGSDDGDELYGEAKEVVVAAGKASASLLQRRLKVGYARAARLLDLLEDKGVIGAGDGAKPREVYIRPDGTIAQEPANLVGLHGATGINADSDEAEVDEA